MNIETDCHVCKQPLGEHPTIWKACMKKVLWNRTTYSVWAWRHKECKTVE